jgi:DNA-binding NarL/FixJ family response regulator
MQMISVVIADDHAVVRTGLQLIFQESSDIIVKSEADNGSQLLSLLNEACFDVAIVDVSMPGINSIDLVAAIKAHSSHLPVVIFTMNTDEQLAARMFKHGAMAYINKEEDPQELIKAVKSAANRKRYLTRRQEYFFANQFIMGDGQTTDLEKLTDREYQIMRLLASGKSKGEISIELAISKNTLSNHRNNILKKLNLTNNVELTKYALLHNIIQQ